MNIEIDVSKVILRTNRLILRPWTMDDLDEFYEYASADGVGQMAGWIPHENKETSLAVLQRFIAEKKTFALEFDGKVIGSLGIEEYDEGELPEFQSKRGRELGFVLSKDYWWRGLMPEAVKAATKYLFDDLDLDFIVCGHFVDNVRSMRVTGKMRFQALQAYQNDHGIRRRKRLLAFNS